MRATYINQLTKRPTSAGSCIAQGFTGLVGNDWSLSGRTTE